MGYETSLLVANRVVLEWRKVTSPLPRLLFRHDQVLVDRIPVNGHTGSRPARISVQYRSTARETLSSLDSAGLGWAATLAAYTDTVITRGFAAGLFLARSLHLEGADDEEGAATEREQFVQFDGISLETDLDHLGKLLVHQIFSDQSDDETEEWTQDLTILGQLTLGGTIDSIATTVFAATRYADKNALGLNIFALARAVESWCVLNQDAPLIAWPMLIAAVLRAVDPKSIIVYDLTDDAYETRQIESVREGMLYAQEYWTASGESLASTARVVGKLFAVLASFDGDLSREYWFARATTALDRLNTLRNSGGVSSKRIGDALEDVVEAIIRTEQPQLEVIERNLRTRESEIDLAVANGLDHPFWLAHRSPVIIFECKNSAAKIGIPDLRIFESKMEDRHAVCRIGIFVSMAGFTDTFYKRILLTQRSGGLIFAVSGSELTQIVGRKQRLTEWLRTDGMAAALGNRSKARKASGIPDSP